MKTYDEWVQSLQEREWLVGEIESELLTDPSLEGNAERAVIGRMNLIGGMRSEGWIIPKTRGRYQITGFEEKVEKLPFDQWPEENRRGTLSVEARGLVFDYSHQYMRDWISLLCRSHRLHSEGLNRYQHNFSPLVLCAYYLATHRIGHWFNDHLLAKKFTNQPRWYIVMPSTDSSRREFLTQFIDESLAKSSRIHLSITQSVEHPDIYAEWKKLGWKPNGKLVQAVYNLEIVADDSAFLKSFSKESRRRLRRLGEDLIIVSYRDAENKTIWRYDAKTLIDRWREGPAGKKQRQLAIRRDFLALEMLEWTPSAWEVSSIAYREVEGRLEPASLLLLDRAEPDCVWDVASKSLNYPSLIGGASKTATAHLRLEAQRLSGLGVQYFNAGGYDGGAPGLIDYKRKIVEKSGGFDLTCRQWYFPGDRYVG